jgi:hypothetical protein
MTLQDLAMRRARPARRIGIAWTLTWIVLAVDAIWLSLGSWTVSVRGVALVLAAVAVFHAPLAFRRYRHDPLIHPTLRAASLLIVFMAAAGTLSYLMVSTNARLVDATLAAWDHALGFDWLRLAAWLQSRPDLETPLHFAYASGLPQIVFVVLFLGFSGRAAQLDTFMRLFILATLATVLLSGPFPAAGSAKYFAAGTPMTDIVASMSHFEPLRDGRMRDIPLGLTQGLISFPSLHTVLAVLLVHAMRGTVLLPAFVALDTAMIVATPVDGGHYLVDVLAGALLAGVLIVLERRRTTDARALPATGDRRQEGTKWRYAWDKE